MNPKSGPYRVRRTTTYQTNRWYFLPRTYKDVHAIGRTVPRLGSVATQEQVNQVADDYQYEFPVMNLSVVQQLDFLATEILRKDRTLHREATGHHRHDNYLTPVQWSSRARREIPFPDVEKLATLMRHPKFRFHNYGGRISDRPFDKKGNHYAQWSRSPLRVGRDVDWEPKRLEGGYGYD